MSKVLCYYVLLLLGVQAPLAAGPGPLPPEAALRSFQLDPGLEIELVAAEPIVVAPCAVAWDDRGRLFVVENRGYPTATSAGKPLGRITLLEDINRDGRMDKRTDYATDLTFPNGLLPWDGGLIVTCAPDVLFLKDSDGDGKAEVREVWLTGFDDKNTTQLRVSHPTLGPDGWVYLTSGFAGESTVRSPAHPERTPVKLRSDSRFHPHTLEFEAIDGRAQFGQTFDDAGNRFTCFNRVHIQHVVLSSRHLRRNPQLAFAETIQNVPETLLSDMIGGAHQNPAARIYPISDNITTADSHAGQFSAACGLIIYRGDSLPREYHGDAFACDPTGNLVHRDKLIPAGMTFSARMANEGREFLASADNWFRPVNLAVGADGALYVCDMYRKTIEHPEYLPEDVRKRTDFDGGKDKGRVWRVSGKDSRKKQTSALTSKSPKQNGQENTGLAQRNIQDLIELLSHPNVWDRETASRLLLERKATNAVPLLLKQLPVFAGNNDEDFRKLPRAAAPQDEGPERARANALNLIFALSGGRTMESRDKAEIEEYFRPIRPWLKNEDSGGLGFLVRLIRATLDESPIVRTAAFRLLDSFPGEGPDIGDVFHYLWADDPNPHVRLRVALFLGKCGDGATFAALARIARQDGGDRWMRAAVLSGLKDRANHFLETLNRETNGVPAPEFMRALCALAVNPFTAVHALTDADAGARPFRARQIRSSSDAAWQIAGLAGTVDSLRALAGTNSVPKLVDYTDKPFGDPPQWKTERRHLLALLTRAETLMADPKQPASVRDAALSVLLHERPEQARLGALKLLRPAEDPDVQRRVIQGLVSLPGGQGASELLQPDRWKEFAPSLRAFLLSSLLAHPRHIGVVLTAIESGPLSGSDISRAQRDQLRKQKDESLRARAEKLFASSGGDRMKIYDDLKPVSALKGDAAHGRELFRTHCASCHRLDREGVAVGPDIFGVRNQPKEAILLHLLVPNHEINPDFTAYEIQTRDGRGFVGIIAAETPGSVLVRQAQGIEETIRRADIVAMKASNISLMPDELEKGMSRQDLADLLSCLKGE